MSSPQKGDIHAEDDLLERKGEDTLLLDTVDSGSNQSGEGSCIDSSTAVVPTFQDQETPVLKEDGSSYHHLTLTPPPSSPPPPCNAIVVRKRLSSIIFPTTPSLTNHAPSIVKRSRVSIIREPPAPSPSSKIPTRLIRWQPIRTELDWSTIKAFPTARIGHRAVLLNSKMIIFAGGNQQIYHDLLVFDTNTKTWHKPQEKGTVPEGRASYGMETLGNCIYIFGGLLEHGFYTNEVFRLDVATWTWTKLEPSGPDVCPRFGHSFTRLNDSFYVFGGLTDDTLNPPRMESPRYLGDFFKLNVVKNSDEAFWEFPPVFGAMPSPRESHSAVAYTTSSMRYNRLIIYGGMCGRRLNDLYFLDVDTCVWTKPTIRGIPSAPRSMHSANLVGSCMYVFGGWTAVSEHSDVGENINDGQVQNFWQVTSDLHCLNLETLTWEQVAQRENPSSISYWPESRAGHTAVAGKTRIYIWGGKDGFTLDDTGRQLCFPEMLELEVDKPGMPGKVLLVNASLNFLSVQWEPVEDADSYLLQCCPYDVPVPIHIQMPVSAPQMLALPPTPPISTKHHIDGEPVQQPQIPSQQTITQIFPFRGPLPQSLSSGQNIMPLVLSRSGTRMPVLSNGHSLQCRLPTGQMITVQAAPRQLQRVQFLHRHRPGQAQSHQSQDQQQQQQVRAVALNYVRNPHHLNTHPIYSRRLLVIPHQRHNTRMARAITYFHRAPLRQTLSLVRLTNPVGQVGLTRLANAAALAQTATDPSTPPHDDQPQQPPQPEQPQPPPPPPPLEREP